MKRFSAFIVLCVLLSAAAPVKAEEQAVPVPYLKAESAILIEQETGKVLFEKNSHTKLFPASMTKNLTALLALENLELDETVSIGDELDLVSSDASVGGLKKGEDISVRELLWALMIPSGNDAAYTIAVHTARKKSGDASMEVPEAVKYFTDMMNTRANEIGCKESSFTNPDGYHDENHFSSAADEALIAREAMKNQLFREIVGAENYTVTEPDAIKGGEKKDKPLVWENKNLMLVKDSNYYYEYATGIKTGHTSKAGYCLSASAEKDGLKLISIVMKEATERDRWQDTKALLDYGFNNYKMHVLFTKGQAITRIGVSRNFSTKEIEIEAVTDRDFSDVFYAGDVSAIKQEVVWKQELLSDPEQDGGPVTLKAPIAKGQVLGTVKYTVNGNVVVEEDILSNTEVKQGNLLDAAGYFAGKLYEERLPVGISIAAAALIVILYKVVKKGRSQ